MFELLSLARTSAGEETLADWLTRAASQPEIVQRQQSVAELSRRLDLREQLSLTGSTIGHTLHSRALGAWAGRSAGADEARGAQAVAIALTLAMLLAIAILTRTAAIRRRS